MYIKYTEINAWLVIILGIHFVVNVVVTADTPGIETSETQVGITQGRTAILPCMIHNEDPYVKVIWKDKDGRTLSRNENVLVDRRKYSVFHPFPNEWNLHIKHVRDTDDGRYTCSTSSTPVQSRIVVLRVDVPPRILNSGTIDVKEDERLDVVCNVTGTPKPTITWYKGDEVMPYVTGETMTVNHAQRKHAGQYKCTADNGVEPSATETFVVDVLYAPKVSALERRILQYKYKDAVIECQVSANPEGKVSWFKNGKELYGNWKYKIVGYQQVDESWINMLTVGMLEKRDYGEYVCFAVNEVGNDSAVITVAELTTPAAPTTKEIPVRRTTQKVSKTSASYIPRSTTPPLNGNQENLVEVPDSSKSLSSTLSNNICLLVCIVCMTIISTKIMTLI
ncbi:hypothetical protein ACF0H5_013698 [Mactra antiquata]